MNKKLNWKELARHFTDFCHYGVMIKIEKDISILREVLVDSDLSGEQRQSIHRQIADLEQKLKLEQAVARLGEMANKSSLFNPNGYPVSAGQSYFGFHSR